MSLMHSEEEIKQLKEELNKVNKEKEELQKTITNLNSELNMEKIKTSNLNINNEELNNKQKNQKKRKGIKKEFNTNLNLKGLLSLITS